MRDGGNGAKDWAVDEVVEEDGARGGGQPGVAPQEGQLLPRRVAVERHEADKAAAGQGLP